MADKLHAGKSYMLFSLSYPNAPALIQSTGFLDISGRAKPRFSFPKAYPKSMTGLSFHHAYVVFGWAFTIDSISNPAPLLLVD